MSKVAVVGLGKIGLPLAALYASKGHEVTGCDISAEVVETKLLPVLRTLVDDKQVFVQEAALITMGRVAATESKVCST